MIYFLILISIFNQLLSSGATFLQEFYKLPDSLDTKKILKQKVFGKIPMIWPFADLAKFDQAKVINGHFSSDGQREMAVLLGGPLNLRLPPGNAAYIERGISFSRVISGEKAFLAFDERVRTLINFNNISENLIVTAWTKDGIEVRLTVIAEFKLSICNDETSNELFHFDKAVIRNVVERALLDGYQGNDWPQVACRKSKEIIRHYISQNHLEQIFIRSGPQALLLSRNRLDILTSEINKSLTGGNIEVSLLQVSALNLPRQISQQILKLWSSGHRNLEILAESQAKAHELYARKQALAQMVRELVFNLTHQLERIEPFNSDSDFLSQAFAILNRGMMEKAHHTDSSRKAPDGIESPKLDGINYDNADIRIQEV